MVSSSFSNLEDTISVSKREKETKRDEEEDKNKTRENKRKGIHIPSVASSEVSYDADVWKKAKWIEIKIEFGRVSYDICIGCSIYM